MINVQDLINDIKTMSGLCGVSGCEDEVRDYIVSEIAPYCDEVTVDNIGNVVAKKTADKGEYVMLSAPMDESGLIATDIDPSGYLKFDTVGRVDTRALASRYVKVNGLTGVASRKAIHLIPREERGKAVAAKKLMIDIGASSKEEAEKYVRPGDYCSFDTDFLRLNNKLCGKAVGGRSCCKALIETLKSESKRNILAVFNVQNEIGSRGAKVEPGAAVGVDAEDIEYALVLDFYDAGKNAEIECGRGVAVPRMISETVVDGVVINKIKEAFAADISMQETAVVKEHSAAEHIGVVKSGILTAALGIPVYGGAADVSDIMELIKALNKLA